MNFDICPAPLPPRGTIQMAHGGGGRVMNDFLHKVVMPLLGMPKDGSVHDSSVVVIGDVKLAFTTDSYVVNPLFFPGGDIGTLAVNGTVNDLAMSGARPLHLSCALIIEEGFAQADLARILASMRRAADEAGVTFVTGDTKVIDRGKGDGLYVNTAGIGVVTYPTPICAKSIRSGDAIVVSGDLGRHAIAVMAARAGFELDGQIASDCAPLHRLVGDLLESGVAMHCLRDLTRGGLATALVELAEASGLTFTVNEAAVPVASAVRGACELLGFDPLYLANEGRCIAFVGAEDADSAVKIMRRHGDGAAVIGRVGQLGTDAERTGRVQLASRLGTVRTLLMLSGEQLPRIC